MCCLLQEQFPAFCFFKDNKHRGRRSAAPETLIIMTSNVGAKASLLKDSCSLRGFTGDSK